MSELVASWLVFTHPSDQWFGDVLESLYDDGWETPKRGGHHRCLVDGKLKKLETVAEILSQTNSGTSAGLALERGGLEVTIEKNADTERSPTGELTSFYVWAWDTEFEPPRDGWNGRGRTDATREYVDLVRTAVEAVKPNYGYGKYPEYVDFAALPTYDDVLDGRVRGTFWLNVFGPEYIESVGRSRIDSAPAWLVEELATGHLLVVASDNPVRPSAEYEGALNSLAAHLGVDRG